jgi:hypothetical protein
MNVAIFWNIALRSPYVKRHFEGTYHFHLRGRKSDEEKQNARIQVMLASNSGDPRRDSLTSTAHTDLHRFPHFQEAVTSGFKAIFFHSIFQKQPHISSHKIRPVDEASLHINQYIVFSFPQCTR